MLRSMLMRKIGITGGVGSGKSQVLSYMEEDYHALVLRADDVSRDLMEPGGRCYEKIRDLFGAEYLLKDGAFDRKKIADKVFLAPDLLDKMNAILHPAVISEIIAREKKAEESGCPIVCVESALLPVMQEKGNETFDELWYVYADELSRRIRLKESRGYTDEKISSIMANQLTEEGFRQACQVVIDNSGSFEDTKRQIDIALGE